MTEKIEKKMIEPLGLGTRYCPKCDTKRWVITGKDKSDGKKTLYICTECDYHYNPIR